MTSESATDLVIRRYEPGDLRLVMELARRSLGWHDDERHAALFKWKHFDNPFGVSPAWLAFDGDRLAALRVLMRWEFLWAGRQVAAVRAVDTATDPDYQGRGLFRTLTTAAVEQLSEEGVDFVFNTPNDQSRPGYLKMGWEIVGRLPVWARPAGVVGLVRMRSARVPADLWSVASSAGMPAHDVLSDESAIRGLLESQPEQLGVVTRRSVEFLRWRYGLANLTYRAVTGSRGADDGIAVFRVRQRGGALETAVCDVIAPDGDQRSIGALTRAAVRAAEGGHGVGLGQAQPSGFVRLRNTGPLLTSRRLHSAPPGALSAWQLNLGDVELF